MRRRPYTPIERQKAVDAGRERILTAARQLLDDQGGEGFSVDAVARRAGVSRMTVYNQFESKARLLEALFDSLASRGPISQMSAVFAAPNPREALDEFIAVLGRFWTYSRRAHDRLGAAASQDAELAAAIAGRNERRRQGITELVRRLSKDIKPVVPRDEVVNLLFVLLSFQNFDAIAGKDRTPTDIVPLMQRTVHALLGLSDKPRPRAKRSASRS